MAGLPAPLLAELRAHGTLRAAPFHPPDDVVGLIDTFAASPQWLWGRSYTRDNKSYTSVTTEAQYGMRCTIVQLLRLIGAPLPPDATDRYAITAQTNDRLLAHLKTYCATYHPHWDAASNTYWVSKAAL